MDKLSKFGRLRFESGKHYTVDRIANRYGKTVLRLKFKNFEEMELFFIEELIGSDVMEGSASKVIGTTLLIWDR